MSLRFEIPKSSECAVIGGIFQASFNAPTIGYYDFTNYPTIATKSNVAVDLGLAMNANYLYYFHQFNFSLSCDEGTFLQAIAPGTFPEFKLRDSITRKMLYHHTFRLIRYYSNAAIDFFYYNLNNNSKMIGDFQGLFIQPASLVGVTNLYAQVSFTVYEITDVKFIMEHKKDVQF